MKTKGGNLALRSMVQWAHRLLVTEVVIGAESGLVTIHDFSDV
jgi:hypothetical protein